VLAKRLINENLLCDRIFFSNISDMNYMGIDNVLRVFSRLLNKKENPESTLISLFMNWMKKGLIYDHPKTKERFERLKTEKMMAALKKLGIQPGGHQKITPVIMDTVTCMSDVDCREFDIWTLWKEWAKRLKVEEIAAGVGLRMREVNRVVPRRQGVSVGGRNDEEPNELIFGTGFREVYVEFASSKDST
jgi:hypothetical protein